MVTTVKLCKPLERHLLSGHPWVYREALEPFSAAPGTIVRVKDTRGRPIAIGLAEQGPIAVRVFATGSKDVVGPGLFRRRLELALQLRTRVIPDATDAYRLVHGEGDRLPGLVCDRYGRFAVVRLDGQAIGAHRDIWAPLLQEALADLGVHGALVRTVRRDSAQGAVTQLFGEAPPLEVAVRECATGLLANLWEGQKTGLFLDHRPARALVRRLAGNLRVLNLYGYTGGFSVAAALGGATHVTTVDVAPQAIALAERTFSHNGLPASLHRAVAEDVPAFIEQARARNERYDLVIADPPNFAPQLRSVPRARESYQKLHASCAGLLEDGGLYLAASCSSHIRMMDFVEDLREGARRARRVLTVLEQHGAPADHPRLLAFPEGDYLKVLLCRVERT